MKPISLSELQLWNTFNLLVIGINQRTQSQIWGVITYISNESHPKDVNLLLLKVDSLYMFGKDL